MKWDKKNRIVSTYWSGNASKCKKSKQRSIKNAVRVQKSKYRPLVHIFKNRTYLQTKRKETVYEIGRKKQQKKKRKEGFFLLKEGSTSTSTTSSKYSQQQLQWLLRQVSKDRRGSQIPVAVAVGMQFHSEPKEEAHPNLA